MEISSTKRWLLFGVLLSLALAIRIHFFSTQQYQRSADEGYYLKYAQGLKERGFADYSIFYDEYIQSPNDHLFPSPLRIGYYTLTFLTCEAMGRYDPLPLTLISSVSGFFILVVSFLFARKLFDDRIALLALLAFVFSPLLLLVSRYGYQDAFSTLCVLTSLYFFWNVLDGCRNKSESKNECKGWLLFSLVFFFTILVKESNVLLILPLAILGVWQVREGEKLLKPLVLSLGVPCLAALLIYLISAGSFEKVFRVISIILHSPETNLYAQKYQNGPWFTYVVSMFLVSPFVTLVALLYLGYVVYGERSSRGGWVLLVVIATGLLSYSFFIKNLRYVVFLDVPLRIACVAGLVLVSEKFQRSRSIVLIVLCLTMVVIDWVYFHRLFVSGNIYDPVNNALLRTHGIIPWNP
jgi:4-amino-4-deoxy-L-arabinose transferase-like glycosyltransferase